MANSVAYHAFLSYRSDDRPIVLKVADELKKRGCSCFLDQWYLAPGQDWVAALEKALASSRSVAIFVGAAEEMGRWQQRERAWALDRQAGDSQFPVIPVLMPGCKPPLGFLGQLMWIDLRENPTDPEQLDRLAAVIRGEPMAGEGQRQPQVTVCPYRGLLYFREEDAPFFFGRDTYIQQLVSKVEQHALVAVVGASGSGKSSVVRAGLLPRLRAPDRQEVWEIVTMVPGTNPLHSLAKVLFPLIEPELSGYEIISKSARAADDLKNDRVSLRNLIDGALEHQRGANRLLLVVDQWEELYTQCDDTTERQKFIQQVLAATARDRSPLTVVLTLRADFYGRLLQDRALLDQLQDGRLDLGPMTPEELREAIEKPATAVGLTFQAGLVDRLLVDAREEPGRLPLMEFALEELWKRHDSGHLTHSAYETLGRLSGAIAIHAERIYAEFDKREQEAGPALFRRLVRAGTKTEEDTRRRADLRSLDEASQRIVRRLADERLLVTTRIAAGGDISEDKAVETVEVAHEELLRRWSRLSKWIDADRKFLQWRGRLAPSLEQYHRDPTSALLRYGALREAKQFYPERKTELEDDEKKLLTASFHAETRRLVGVRATFALFFVVLLVAWAAVHRHGNYVRANAAIEKLPDANPTQVASILDDLQLAQKHASEQLHTRYRDEQNSHYKLRLAFGLIAVGAVSRIDDEEAQYVIGQIANARADDSANLVHALAHLPNRAQLMAQLLNRASHESVEGVQTRYRVAALSLDDMTAAAQLTVIDGDPSNRTRFIHDVSAWPGNVKRICELLPTVEDQDIRSGLCIAIGGVDPNSRSEEERQSMRDTMTTRFQDSSDSGTHSAAGWALRQWKFELPVIPRCTTQHDREQLTENRSWFRNSLGMTMIQIPRGTYRIGSEKVNNNPIRDVTESEFWLSACEVTVAEFLELLPDVKTPRIVSDAETDSGRLKPVSEVTWYDAVEFCNCLSEKEGLEPCYEIQDVERDESNSIESATVEIVPGNGYRLPTEVEWEIACRAGTSTDYSFGSHEDWLSDYGWHSRNADRGALPVAEKRPNPWGLFDMHGNVWEWSQDRFEADGSDRVYRGGGWNSVVPSSRSAFRSGGLPSNRSVFLGFRLALSPFVRKAERLDR